MDYAGNDFYCDVALKKAPLVPLKKEYESDNVLAFHHTKPHWPVHIVVVPKKHIASFTSITAEDAPILTELFGVLKRLAARIEAKEGRARIVTNLGAYQDSKHLHFHIVSGEQY